MRRICLFPIFFFAVLNVKSFAQSQSYTRTFGAMSNGSAQHCRIEIHKKGTSEQKTEKYTLDGRRIVLRQGSFGSNSGTVSNVLVSSGETATISLDQEKVRVKCVRTQAGIFHLSISLFEGKAARLQTNISVKRGQKIDLGSIVQDLNNKDKGYSVKPSIKYGTIQKNKQSSYDLIVR